MAGRTCQMCAQRTLRDSRKCSRSGKAHPLRSSPKNICSTAMCAPSRQLCPEAVVSRSPLGIRRGEERRPGRVRFRGGVSILRRSWNRVPRPPEVVVVLVVPAVDRRVRPAQVLQREEPRAVGGVETGPCDELPGNFVPTQYGCALPPPGNVGLLVGPGRAGGSAQALDLIELSRPLLAVERRRWRRTELRGALEEERPHVAHPRGRIQDRLPRCRVELRLPVSGVRGSTPTE